MNARRRAQTGIRWDKSDVIRNATRDLVKALNCVTTDEWLVIRDKDLQAHRLPPSAMPPRAQADVLCA